MATRQAGSIEKLLAGMCVVALLLSTPAAASMIEGFPDVVVCRAGDKQTLGYLHRVMDDGSAVYMALGGEFATVTPDGILNRHGADARLALVALECHACVSERCCPASLIRLWPAAGAMAESLSTKIQGRQGLLQIAPKAAFVASRN